MKRIPFLLLILLSTGVLAEGQRDYFKDRNIFLRCNFVPTGKNIIGLVLSYHHFWNGSFGSTSSPLDKHYTFATWDYTDDNMVLRDTETKVNYVFYEWGLESDLTTGCKRIIETNYSDEEYISRETTCPAGETIFTIPQRARSGFDYSNTKENVYYRGDNEEIIEISLGPSSFENVTDGYNHLKISRISLKPTNVPTSTCAKIDFDEFVKAKEDFYKLRDEDSKRIQGDFAL